MRNSFVKKLYEKAIDNQNIIMMCGDLGYGVLSSFYEKLPNQFINAGISEQNMTSAAAGMALNGDVIFTYSIANFPSLRCLEQIRNDVAYHNANVNIISVGAGLAYGSSGMSHHAVDDMGAIRSIPGIEIYSPADRIEAIAVIEKVLDSKNPSYIRLGKGGESLVHKEDEVFDISKILPIVKNKTAKIAILVTGDICIEAIKAQIEMKENDINVDIYSVAMIKPIDENTLINIVKDYEFVYTLEEHSIIGGLGSAVSEIVAENNGECKFKRIGIRDVFTGEVGDQNYLRKFYGISATSIVKIIKEDFES